MMTDFLLESKLGFTLLIACIVALVICLWVGSSYYEAKAFNRVTGKNVSTLDAMFTRLIVQSEVAD